MKKEVFKKFRRKKALKTGMPPGSLVYVGEKSVEKISIKLIQYDQDLYDEKLIDDIENLSTTQIQTGVTWLSVRGLNEIEVIDKIGSHFDIHPLILEDILNTEIHPKIERFGDKLFICLKFLSYNEPESRIESEQVSIVLSKNLIISFQETHPELFAPIEERIKNKVGRFLQLDASYLCYSLMDFVIDHYFEVFEHIDAEVEALEEELLDKPSNDTIKKIHQLRKSLISVTKSVKLLREVVRKFEIEEIEFIDKAVLIYIRDLYDHVIQIINTLDTIREMLASMLEMYLSSTNNKLNEVMKVLTMIATIFIPLTFLAGLYGMNFLYMPEIKWQWGYPFALLLMALVAGVMVLFFKRKKWI